MGEYLGSSSDTYDISYYVEDEFGNNNSLQIAITVTDGAENKPIEFGALHSQELTVSKKLSFPITITDPDSGPLELEAIGLPEGASFEGISGGWSYNEGGYQRYLFEWTPMAEQVGDYIIEFQGSDEYNNNNKAFAYVYLEVKAEGAPNTAPVFDPLETHIIHHGAVSYGIVIGATDSGGDTMTLSVNGIPVSEDSLEITHNEPGRIEAVLWVNTWDPSETYDIVYHVRDGHGGYSLVKMPIVITDGAENLPVIFEQPQEYVYTITAGQEISFSVRISDTDCGPLELEAIGLPEGASFEGISGGWSSGSGYQEYLFEWTPTAGQEGDCIFIFYGNDTYFSNHSYAFVRIRVLPVDGPHPYPKGTAAQRY